MAYTVDRSEKMQNMSIGFGNREAVDLAMVRFLGW